MAFISRLVGLQPRQWRRAITLWALWFCLAAAFELARGTVMSIFLERLGSRELAPAFVLEGVLRLAAAALYLFLVKRVSYSKLMTLAAGAYAVSLLMLISVLGAESNQGLMFFFVVERVSLTLIMMHWGVYLVDFFTVRESATAIPFVYSAQPLGALPAGVLLAFCPGLSESDLFFIPVALVVASTLFIWRTARLLPESPRIRVAPQTAVKGEVRRYLLRAPVVRYMALATAVMVFVRASLEVSYSAVLECEFSDAAHIREFWGNYVIWANLAVFAAQFLFSARLMRAFAPTRVNLVYAGGVVVSFLTLFVCPGATAIVFAKFVRKEVKSILKTPFSIMIYGAMADYARPFARMAIFGVVIPLSGIITGLLLMGLEAADASTTWIVLPGLAGAVAFVGVSMLQNRAYKLALIELLEHKLTESSRSGATSTLLRQADGRILDIRAVRERVDYYLVRGRYARKLFPDLYSGFDPTADDATVDLEERLDELLLLVELYRPKGAPHVRGLLVAALKDQRTDLVDNAAEVIDSILPASLARKGRTLVSVGLEKGVQVS